MQLCSEKFRHDTCSGIDVVLADAGYRGLDRLNINVLLPHSKPRGGQRTVEQIAWNQRQAAIRSRIERLFGKLKNTFVIFLSSFHGHIKRLEQLFRICCAILNEERRIALNLPHNF
jgi:hypothetical protein